MTLLTILGTVVYHLFESGDVLGATVGIGSLIIGILSLKSGYRVSGIILRDSFKTKCRQFEIRSLQRNLLFVEFASYLCLITFPPFALVWEPGEAIFPILLGVPLMGFALGIANRATIARLSTQRPA